MQIVRPKPAFATCVLDKFLLAVMCFQWNLATTNLEILFDYCLLVWGICVNTAKRRLNILIFTAGLANSIRFDTN